MKEILLISPNFIGTEKEFLLTFKIKKTYAEIFPILLDVCAYARCLVNAGISYESLYFLLSSAFFLFKTCLET